MPPQHHDYLTLKDEIINAFRPIEQLFKIMDTSGLDVDGTIIRCYAEIGLELTGTFRSKLESCLVENGMVLTMPNDNSWNVVYASTREQAIADGVLADVTEAAKAIGFKRNTVVTDHLFHGYVEVPSGLEGEGQSATGRLHDLMVLALFAARKAVNADRVNFKVSFLMAPGRMETVEVVAHIGPGDNGEPVLTIMLPEDDEGFKPDNQEKGMFSFLLGVALGTIVVVVGAQLLIIPPKPSRLRSPK